MGTFLWILQWVLALMFLMAGVMKMMQPKEKLAEKMGWVNDFSSGAVKTIGMLEVLGAIGLVVPPLVGVAPDLTPAAAAGLVLLMIGAARVHLRRNEPQMVMINTMLGVMALVVAWGRFISLPF